MTLEGLLNIMVQAELLTIAEAEYCLITPLHILPDDILERLKQYSLRYSN